MPFLPDVTLIQLVLIVGLAAFSAIARGVAGYGTGGLMPLMLERKLIRSKTISL